MIIKYEKRVVGSLSVPLPCENCRVSNSEKDELDNVELQYYFMIIKYEKRVVGSLSVPLPCENCKVRQDKLDNLK